MNKEDRRNWRLTVFGFTAADLRPAQKVVLLALETFADYPAGTNARPGINNLAAMCALDERTVRFALKAGERLELIEQTARANPKRHLAAVYRLLPQPVSTGPLDPVEDVSTGPTDPLEPDFYRIESRFLPDQIDVSTGSLDPPTNPVPIQDTKREGARATEAEPLDVEVVPGQNDTPPSNSGLIGKLDAVVGEVVEDDSDPEPQLYCERHMPHGTDAPCGACGGRRKAHERWTRRHPEPSKLRALAELADQARRREARQSGNVQRAIAAPRPNPAVPRPNPPAWVDGPHGPRCPAHGHLRAAPPNCERCQDAAIAAKGTA